MCTCCFACLHTYKHVYKSSSVVSSPTTHRFFNFGLTGLSSDMDEYPVFFFLFSPPFSYTSSERISTCLGNFWKILDLLITNFSFFRYLAKHRLLTLKSSYVYLEIFCGISRMCRTRKTKTMALFHCGLNQKSFCDNSVPGNGDGFDLMKVITASPTRRYNSP